MIPWNKISHLVYFIVILLGYQTCLHGAEGGRGSALPLDRVFSSCQLKSDFLNTGKRTASAFVVATASERDPQSSSVIEQPMPRNNKAEADSGMVFDLDASVAAIDPEQSLQLSQVIDAILDKPVIFIGERHANYEDHEIELEIIMRLHKKGKKFALGMEMFQRPFQKSIDQYLAGAISEREFLKNTEYFMRWGMDYNLYRGILEFARSKMIPVLALNQRSEIMHKVAKGGLESLSADDRMEVPQDLDMSDESYKKRLAEVYENHPHNATFEHFYQSQILWDETMAQTAARFMKERPDHQVVVLAGVEHIMYGSGIPHRLYRRTGKDYVTLINGVFDKNIGTYVLFTRPIKPPFSAKLGIMVLESDNRVRVDAFSKDSIALKAGLKEGDIISTINGWTIENNNDIKLALFDMKRGQTVHVTVIRKRFILGDKKLDFSLPL